MLTPTLPGLSVPAPVERKPSPEAKISSPQKPQRSRAKRVDESSQKTGSSQLTKEVLVEDQSPTAQIASTEESQREQQLPRPPVPPRPALAIDQIHADPTLTSADSWPSIFFGSSVSRSPEEIRRPSPPRSAALNLPTAASLPLRPAATTRVFAPSTPQPSTETSTDAAERASTSRRAHTSLDLSRLVRSTAAVQEDQLSDNPKAPEFAETEKQMSAPAAPPENQPKKVTALPAIPQRRVVPRPSAAAGEIVAPLRQSVTARQPPAKATVVSKSKDLTSQPQEQKTPPPPAPDNGASNNNVQSPAGDGAKARPEDEHGYWFGDGEHISGAVRAEVAGRIAIDHAVLGTLTISKSLFAGRLVEIFLRNGDRLIGDLVRETEHDVTIRHISLGEISVRRSEICPRVANYLLKNGDRIVGEVLAENEERIELRTSALGLISVPRSGIQRVLQQTY